MFAIHLSLFSMSLLDCNDTIPCLRPRWNTDTTDERKKFVMNYYRSSTPSLRSAILPEMTRLSNFQHTH
jgi:hypothetical protein